MKKVYQGKTKDVYQLTDGNFQLFFKDDVTGKDGVFDPGANEVGLTIKDNGYYGLLMSQYFFELFEKQGINTHYVSSDLAQRTMIVKPVTFFGQGVEVICRLVATGSFIRRYGAYIKDKTPIQPFVEVSLKDDERGDPFISEELLERLNIMTSDEYQMIKSITLQITDIIASTLKHKNIELYDLKLEFGKNSNGNIVLIDEISGGNMRAYLNGASLTPIELAKLVADIN